MSAEDLFAEVASSLDKILCDGDESGETCRSLWGDTLSHYREVDANSDTPDILAEVAMTLYCVVFCLASVSHEHYRITLAGLLHKSIHDKYKDKDNRLESILLPEVRPLSESIAAWMSQYFYSENSLVESINALFAKPKKPEQKNKRKKIEHPTINYVYNGKGRNRRLQIVMKMFVLWKYIENPDYAEDFYNLFSGQDKKLNFKWIGTSTVLYIFIQYLLLDDNDTFICKQTGASAMSIARNVLSKTPNGDKSRLTDDDVKHIEYAISILNPTTPITIVDGVDKGRAECFDIDEEYLVEQLVKEGHLTVIKDLHKKFGLDDC